MTLDSGLLSWATRVWNCLPPSVNFSTLRSFKYHIINVYFTSFKSMYNFRYIPFLLICVNNNNVQSVRVIVYQK